MVDYYRVAESAYPLPVPGLSIPEVVVPGIADYPWTVWMLWALEERILAGLGGRVVPRPGRRPGGRGRPGSLGPLARVPPVSQARPSSAHAGRILVNAVTRWHWPGESLRRSLREACRCHAESVLGAAETFWLAVRDKSDILGRQSPHEWLQNIPVIGAIVAAMTAAVAGHHEAVRLSTLARALSRRRSTSCARGFTEAVAYDGYVLDFIADWLGTLPAGDRAAVVEHPRFEEVSGRVVHARCAGAAGELAELSDVEPREMPFHLSAQAKLLSLRPNPVRSWLLGRSPVELLRTDALAARLREGVAPAAAPWPGARCPLCGPVPQWLGAGGPGRGRLVQHLAHGPPSSRQRNAGARHAGTLARCRSGLPAVRSGRTSATSPSARRPTTPR